MASQALATQEKQERSLISDMAAQYGVEPAKFMEAIKKTVFPSNVPVSNEQLLAFLVVAKTYNLNPFTRELYAFPANGGIVPVISVDGRVSMTQRHEQYDGCEFADHEKDGKLISITCTIFRKDRSHPTVVTEYLSECKRSTDPWNKMERRMLRHKAFIQASRYAFGFSGLYDEDEARDVIDASPVIPGRLEVETLPAANTPAPVTSELAVYFCVGKTTTVLTGAVPSKQLTLADLKAVSVKQEGDGLNRVWTIPAAMTEDFLQLAERKNVPAIQIDERGNRVYEGTDADLPASLVQEAAKSDGG